MFELGGTIIIFLFSNKWQQTFNPPFTVLGFLTYCINIEIWRNLKCLNKIKALFFGKKVILSVISIRQMWQLFHCSCIPFPHRPHPHPHPPLFPNKFELLQCSCIYVKECQFWQVTEKESDGRWVWKIYSVRRWSEGRWTNGDLF